MPEDTSKMKSIRAAYKGHCTQDFKKAEKHMASETSDRAELEALVDRLTRRAEEIAHMDAKIALRDQDSNLWAEIFKVFSTVRFGECIMSQI